MDQGLRTPFQIYLQLCAEQERSPAGPCLELQLSLDELEQRLNSFDERSLHSCAEWLGVEIGRLVGLQS